MSHKEELEYQDLSEVLAVTKEQISIDLLNYAQYNQPELTHALEEPVPAVYPIRSVSPILTFGPGAYSIRAHRQRRDADLQNFDQFVRCRELAVNQQGRPILRTPPILHRQMLSPEPVRHPYEIRLMAARIYWYLNQLHHKTWATTSLAQRELNERQYFQPGAEDEFLRHERSIIGLSLLLDQLDLNFIKDDVHCIYHLDLHDTVLTLKKGHDYRVIEYYRHAFEKLEDQRELETGFRKSGSSIY